MKRIVTLAAVMAALLSVACPGRRSSQQDAPPTRGPAVPGNRLNVLLLTIDTLRADHLGLYGYRRNTSPRLDAFARRAAVFDQAYTYWPKTRGSFVALFTGRTASLTGYGNTHPLLLGFNPTLASVLQDAGYETVATVDNPNVGAKLGYAKGFSRYRETFEESALATEMDRTRAITEDGVRYLKGASPDRPFLLWLHYVNPHAPYEPPAPWDTAFLDPEAQRGPVLGPVREFHGGVHAKWARPGKRLGWYVAQYDGEIATVDAEVGKVLDALDASAVRETTLVVVTSDHGESLGEHDYYFDHGHNLFDPSQRVPLLIAGPSVAAGTRSDTLASTLDLLPTVLDALKISYPPDLAGESLLRATRGGPGPERARLLGQNDRQLLGSWDRRLKIVATPLQDGSTRYGLFDRQSDPKEARDLSRSQPELLRVERRNLELVRDRLDAQAVRTRRQVEGHSGQEREEFSPGACERLQAMGYIQQGCS